MPFYICPNCKRRSVDTDGYEGFSTQAVQCRECGFGFLFELLEDYYPAPATGFVVCDRDARVLAAGRGVFELTGFRDGDLLGHDVVDALSLSDPSPIERRPGVGRAQARPAARDPDEGRARQGRRPSTSSRLRRRRRHARRADAAVARRVVTRSAARSRPGARPRAARRRSAKRAVPAKSLRPSSPSGQRDDDAVLARPRDTLDARGHATEDDLASARRPDRVGARTVDRRPDDRTRGLARRPRSGCSGCRPATAPAWIPSPSRPRASRRRSTRGRRGSRSRRSRVAGVLGLGARHRRRQVDVERRRACLGDDRVTVEQHRRPVVRGGPASGRSSGGGSRSVTSTVVGVDERGEAAARVAAVRGGERAAETPRRNVISIGPERYSG